LKLFINFYFQTERQIHQDEWGSARTSRLYQPRLYEKCSQMIEKGTTAS